MISRTHKGHTLLELILALVVLLLVVAGVTSLAFGYLETNQRSDERVEVTLIAQESLEAMQAIARNSWATLTVGNSYGLRNTTGTWQLLASPDTVVGKYTRQISIASVYRDGSCNIVASPGTLDPDTKKVTATISWTGDTGAARNFSQFKYFTNWKNPTPLCTATQAGSLVIDVENATLGSTKKQLEEIILRNEGIGTVTINKFIISWHRQDGTSPGKMTSIKIDTKDYWNGQNGTGTPQGDQPSGTELTLSPAIVIGPGEEIDLTRIRFDTKLDGSMFTITAILGDDSEDQVITEGFLP